MEERMVGSPGRTQRQGLFLLVFFLFPGFHHVVEEIMHAVETGRFGALAVSVVGYAVLAAIMAPLLIAANRPSAVVDAPRAAAPRE